MRFITLLGVILGTCSLTAAQLPVPRPTKDLTVVQSSGKHSSLTEWRGKVVLLQFLYTICAHCQACARMYSKLQTELGHLGLQVAGVAFNSEAENGSYVVANFVDSNNVVFPVGTASRETVLSYLGISIMDRFVVPQIVVVDRKGIIRAQSELLGSEQLQDESYMRSFLEGILKEGKTTAVHDGRAHASARRTIQ